MNTELLAGLGGAVVGWVLGWAKEQLDVLRRRKSVAKALLYEIRANVAGLDLGGENPLHLAKFTGMLNTPLLDDAGQWIILLRPSTVAQLLHYRTFMELLRRSIPDPPAIASEGVQKIAAAAREESVKAREHLERETVHELTEDWE